MKEKGVKCSCIRCREAGHKWLREGVQAAPSKIDIIHRSYAASNGKEFFISAEDTEQDILIGYVRLRIPSESEHRSEIAGKNASIIRELRVYGPMVPVGAKAGDAWQHKGYGRILLKEAESVSQVENRKKILVTSALGTKQYYRRLGYVPDGPYMSKTLGSS